MVASSRPRRLILVVPADSHARTNARGDCRTRWQNQRLDALPAPTGASELRISVPGEEAPGVSRESRPAPTYPERRTPPRSRQRKLAGASRPAPIPRGVVQVRGRECSHRLTPGASRWFGTSRLGFGREPLPAHAGSFPMRPTVKPRRRPPDSAPAKLRHANVQRLANSSPLRRFVAVNQILRPAWRHRFGRVCRTADSRSAQESKTTCTSSGETKSSKRSPADRHRHRALPNFQRWLPGLPGCGRMTAAVTGNRRSANNRRPEQSDARERRGRRIRNRCFSVAAA